jgi:ATP-binding cassette subfamily B protein
MPKPKHYQIYVDVFKYISKTLTDFKLKIFTSYMLLAISQVATRLAEAYLLKHIIDTISTQNPSEVLAKSLLYSLLIYIGIQIAILIVSRVNYILASYIYSNLNARSYQQAFQKISSLSYDFFQDNMSGSILAKIKRFVRSTSSICFTMEYNVFKIISTLAITITALSLTSWKLGVALVSFTIFYSLLTTAIASKFAHVYEEAATHHSKMTGSLADSITNILTIKTFGRSSAEEKSFHKFANKYGDLLFTKWKTNELINGVQILLMIIIELIVWIILINGWKEGFITAGDMAFVQTLLFATFHKLWGVANTILSLNNDMYDAKEMLDIFKQKSSLKVHPNPDKKFQINKGELNLKNICFKYSKDTKVFRDLNLHIPQGQKVGLVGHSGSGKSTLVKLLLRLMDPSQGMVICDGKNIQELDIGNYRSQISYVPQQPLLFHRSVLDNIRYANPKATLKEVVQVAKKAHAHEFITKLPRQYKTTVGERGVKLSGGERQRIAIARALLEPNKILILDEATSALDSISERFIQESLNELMKNRTTIVIAHRLSTIEKLDRILVMKDGQIVEDGSHQDLLKQKGEYHNLWSHQNDGFIQD